jgi:hypothetical protein
MFIIEGADHLGKTHAAQRMVKLAAEDPRYPVRYQHMSRQNAAFNYGSDYLDLLSKYAVQDRFHLGALVYHEPGTLTAENLLTVKRWLRDVGSMVVIFYASDERAYEKSLREQGKAEMFSVEKILEANAKFRKLTYEGVCDFAYDVSQSGWVSDGQLKTWLGWWYSRMDGCANTRRNYTAR